MCLNLVSLSKVNATFSVKYVNVGPYIQLHSAEERSRTVTFEFGSVGFFTG